MATLNIGTYVNKWWLLWIQQINRTHTFYRENWLFLIEHKYKTSGTTPQSTEKLENPEVSGVAPDERCLDSRLFFLTFSLKNVLSRCAISKASDIYFYYTRRIPCNCSLWYLCQWCSFSQLRFSNAINFFPRNDED